MTFKQGSVSKKTKNGWELDRFCNINGYYIPGIASKMFKYFIKNNLNIREITTYADLRFSNGNLYDKLGFNYKYNSDPNYFYIVNKERKNRFTFRKGVLKSKLKLFDPELTEYQNMLNNGHDRIWDCGHRVYEYINS